MIQKKSFCCEKIEQKVKTQHFPSMKLNVTSKVVNFSFYHVSCVFQINNV
jgi:hypothetical protein